MPRCCNECKKPILRDENPEFLEVPGECYITPVHARCVVGLLTEGRVRRMFRDYSLPSWELLR